MINPILDPLTLDDRISSLNIAALTLNGKVKAERSIQYTTTPGRVGEVCEYDSFRVVVIKVQ